MKTAVAGPVASSCNPSISPVTVPGMVPNWLVKEKSKVSAWPGVEASANADTNASPPRVILFMIGSHAVAPCKKASRWRDADMGLPSHFASHGALLVRTAKKQHAPLDTIRQTNFGQPPRRFLGSNERAAVDLSMAAPRVISIRQVG